MKRQLKNLSNLETMLFRENIGITSRCAMNREIKDLKIDFRVKRDLGSHPLAKNWIAFMVKFKVGFIHDDGLEMGKYSVY